MSCGTTVSVTFSDHMKHWAALVRGGKERRPMVCDQGRMWTLLRDRGSWFNDNLHKQDCLSVEGRPLTNVYLVTDDLGLNIRPWPRYHKDIPEHQNEVCRPMLLKPGAQTNMQTRFCSCDLDLDSITLIYELGLSKAEPQQKRQTNTLTDAI